MKLEKPFDRTYMRALFEVGYQMGKKGYPWIKHPPGYQALGAGGPLGRHDAKIAYRS